MRSHAPIRSRLRSLGFALIASSLPLFALATVVVDRAFAQGQPPMPAACSGQAWNPYSSCTPVKNCGVAGVCNTWVATMVIPRCNAPGAVLGDNCISNIYASTWCAARGGCFVDFQNQCVTQSTWLPIFTNPVVDGGSCSL